MVEKVSELPNEEVENEPKSQETGHTLSSEDYEFFLSLKSKHLKDKESSNQATNPIPSANTAAVEKPVTEKSDQNVGNNSVNILFDLFTYILIEFTV